LTRAAARRSQASSPSRSGPGPRRFSTTASSPGTSASAIRDPAYWARAAQDRLRTPNPDRFGNYERLIKTHAERVGAVAEHLYDEWTEAAAIRQYLGELDIDNAERLAWEDLLRSHPVPQAALPLEP
jgi:hypothetical protein